MTTFEYWLDEAPLEWKGPLCDVLDTAEAVRSRLADWGLASDSIALVGMTALVLDEHRRQNDQQRKARSAAEYRAAGMGQ
jgi:hypothetical protein